MHCQWSIKPLALSQFSHDCFLRRRVFVVPVRLNGMAGQQFHPAPAIRRTPSVAPNIPRTARLESNRTSQLTFNPQSPSPVQYSGSTPWKRGGRAQGSGFRGCKEIGPIRPFLSPRPFLFSCLARWFSTPWKNRVKSFHTVEKNSSCVGGIFHTVEKSGPIVPHCGKVRGGGG